LEVWHSSDGIPPTAVIAAAAGAKAGAAATAAVLKPLVCCRAAAHIPMLGFGVYIVLC
jgi:hypothetical protein